MRTVCRFVLAGLILMVGIAVFFYSGFCPRMLWFLSDDAMIDAAVDDIRMNSVHIVETPTGGYSQFTVGRQVRSLSVDEFKRLNPNCCEIVANDPMWVSFWHRLSGQAAKSVLIRYSVRYVNDDGGISRMEAVARRAVGNCGRVLHERSSF